MTIEKNFISACKNVDLINISSLLNEHPYLKKKWGKISTLSERHSLMINASAEGHTDIVMALMTTPSIDVNKVDQDGNTALICASKEGHTEVVKALLQAPDILVNQPDDNRYNALIWAAYEGHTETVIALLNTPGIDVHQVNEEEETAIIAAYQNNHDQIVGVLRQHGAVLPQNINRLNKEQSVHEVSINYSVSVSAQNLLKHYPDLSSVKKIKGELKKLETWLNVDFKKKTSLPTEYCASWLMPAKRCFARLTMLNFTDEHSGISMRQALALVWAGINTPSLSADETRNRRITFLKHLYEIQRGYNFSGEGANPIDIGGADEPTCVSGSFNKLIAALSEVGHPGVQIIFITQALIVEQVPILTQQAFGDLSEHHKKKFAQGWEGKNSAPLQADCFALLKNLVASKLHENYDEFNNEVPNLNQVIEHAVNNVQYTEMDGVIKDWLDCNQKKDREQPKPTVTFSYNSLRKTQTTLSENNNTFIMPENRYSTRTRSFTGSYKE